MQEQRDIDFFPNDIEFKNRQEFLRQEKLKVKKLRQQKILKYTGAAVLVPFSVALVISLIVMVGAQMKTSMQKSAIEHAQLDKKLAQEKLAQLEQAQKAQEMQQLQAEQAQNKDITDTQKVWGDSYEQIDKLMDHYTIEKFHLEKRPDVYHVEVTFRGGKQINRDYLRSMVPDSIVGYAGEYPLDLEKKDYFLANHETESHMVSVGMGDILSFFKSDKDTFKTVFIPELTYLLGRSGQSLMWDNEADYAKATFSDSNKNKFLKESPAWYKQEAPSLMENIYLNVKWSKDTSASFYPDDKQSVITMVSWLRDMGTVADPKKVCALYKGYAKPDVQDIRLFNNMLSGDAQKICG